MMERRPSRSFDRGPPRGGRGPPRFREDYRQEQRQTEEYPRKEQPASPPAEMDKDSKLLINDKDIVVPGERLAEGTGYLPGRGTYREGNYVIAGLLGILMVDGRALKIIPVSGRYIPRYGDKVIGKVIDVLMTGWRLDINSPYSAVLSMKDATSEFIQRGENLTRFFDLEDQVVCKIVNVTSQKLVDVTTKMPGLRKLRGGRIIEVNCHKVPRIIGKEGSMVMMIKEATGCNITVGQNGWIWLQGTPEQEFIAVNAIRLIEEHSHQQGLTDKIKEYLEKATGKKIAEKPQVPAVGENNIGDYNAVQ